MEKEKQQADPAGLLIAPEPLEYLQPLLEYFVAMYECNEAVKEKEKKLRRRLSVQEIMEFDAACEAALERIWEMEDMDKFCSSLLQAIKTARAGVPRTIEPSIQLAPASNTVQ